MSNTETFVRIDKKELEEIYLQVLVKYGFTLAKAKTCASVFTQNSIDGIYSHSVNRFAKFIEYVKNKYVLPDQEPEKVSGFGGIEQWNGNQGAGVLNAVLATGRACELSLLNGIGCVALANTNHWMRGGFYGWKAAKVGFAFIGWTNTIANMPAWKALDNKLGNNPLVIAIPFAEEAIVLDMAVSQYSFGAIEMHFLKKSNCLFLAVMMHMESFQMIPKLFSILKNLCRLVIGKVQGCLCYLIFSLQYCLGEVQLVTLPARVQNLGYPRFLLLFI